MPKKVSVDWRKVGPDDSSELEKALKAGLEKKQKQAEKKSRKKK